jgi:hypothetical protein
MIIRMKCMFLLFIAILLMVYGHPWVALFVLIVGFRFHRKG